MRQKSLLSSNIKLRRILKRGRTMFVTQKGPPFTHNFCDGDNDHLRRLINILAVWGKNIFAFSRNEKSITGSKEGAKVCAPRSNFFHFHVVFDNNLVKKIGCRPKLKVGASPSGKILDPPLENVYHKKI